MKRSEKNKPIPKGMTRYKKLGGGSFLLTIEGKQKIIKPNQEFDCFPEDIPVNFLDRVIPLSEVIKTAGELEPPSTDPPAKLEYFVKLRSPGYYDVVDKEGKVQNTKALREDKAKELIESLLA